MVSPVRARSIVAGYIRTFRPTNPVLTWGIVGVLVFGVLGLASFYAVGPFGALACNPGPELYVHEAPGDTQGVTHYDDLTNSQQRVFDQARNAEGAYSLNDAESGTELPRYVEYHGTVYEVTYAISECTFETNHLVGISLLAVSALIGIGTIARRVIRRR